MAVDGTRGAGRGRLIAVLVSMGALFTSCGGDSTRDLATEADAGAAGGAPSQPTKGDDCVPYDDTCPSGMYCQYVEGRTQCVVEGDSARDEPCNDGGRCQRGSICLFGSELYGDICQQPCSLDETYGCFVGRHTCFVGTGENGEPLRFGVCRY